MAKTSNKQTTKVITPKGEHWKDSEAKKAALIKYDGLTARQYRAKHSKHAKHHPKSESGNFLVQSLHVGNDAPQTTNFPNIDAALARFIRLSSADNLISVKVIKPVVIYGPNNAAIGTRDVVLYAYTKAVNGQQFCNSKSVTLYKDGNSILSMKAIKNSERLTDKLYNGQLEVHSERFEGGQAWWESHR